MTTSIRVVRTLHDVIGLKAAVDFYVPDFCSELLGKEPAPENTREHSKVVVGDFTILALQEKRIVGYMICCTSGAGGTYIRSFEVCERRRGEGIGSSMMECLKDLNVYPHVLDCVGNNSLAKKFYKRHGFRTAAIIPNAYGYLLDRHVMRRTR